MTDSPLHATAARTRRVLLVEPFGHGGIAHYTYSLAEHLARVGIDITLVTRREYELAARPLAFECRAVLWPMHALRGPLAARRLLSVLRAIANNVLVTWYALRTQPDIVHLQWAIPFSEFAAVPFIQRFLAPVVFTAHNVMPHEPRAAEAGQLRRVSRLAAAVITHGSALRKAAIDRFGLDQTRVHRIAMGVHDFAVPDRLPTRAEARAELGLPGDVPVTLFFGYIRPYKNLEHLLAAFARVHERLRCARLLIAGRVDASATTGGPAVDLRALAARHDVLAATRIDARYLAVEEIPRYFVAADVVVLPYSDASQSGVIQLAFAFARPVIVTNVGSLSEVVDDGVTGFVVPPADADALATCLGEALDDRVRLELMGHNAATTAHQRFSWSSAAHATLAVYESVLRS